MTTFALSVVLCFGYLRFARVRQVFDMPNERSSHSQPTPHGGGAAILLAFTFGLLFAAVYYDGREDSFVLLAVGALLLMVVGIIDDLRGLSARVRMAFYALVCLWAADTLLQPLFVDGGASRTVLWLLAALAMLWVLNLYNFMDGIDGIAALQTVLACCFGAWLALRSGHGDSYAMFCLLLASAHAGFLLWNYPPARLFMGDAGSVPTGFLLAAIALLGAVQGQLNPWCWVILLAIFIADASWTLVWRLFTGQAFTQPHRLHAYQRLSRHWDSHRRVDMLLLAINVLWLFPLAWAVQTWPIYSVIFVILAYVPTLCGVVKVGRLA
ncbi:MAG: glycosyltransferase family 4 protein [Halioglobus sp.]|nr:glycosyltransferase family 4 protein [Halioglobus sp.]